MTLSSIPLATSDLQVGNNVRRNSTLICAPAMADTVDQMLNQTRKAKEQGADLVELRVDYLKNFSPNQDLEILIKQSALPTLVTFRPSWEGGQYNGDENMRLDALRKAVELGSSFVDVELKAADEFFKLIEGKKTENVKIIVSSHNYECTPSAEELGNLVARIQASGADIVKIATTALDITDNARIFQILANSQVPVIGLAMAERGLMSRILSAKFGGFLTFGTIEAGQVSAPGQPTVKDLLELYNFRQIGPDTRVHGVMGNPIGHSKSPHLYNSAFKSVGFNGIYLPLLVDSVANFLNTYSSPDFVGYSYTIPHKEAGQFKAPTMSPYRLIVRSFRRQSILSTTTVASTSNTQSLLSVPQVQNRHTFIPLRSFAFASAEEAAAERRRRKRQLRLKPPIFNTNLNSPRPPPNPDARRLPDSTSALVGPRLSLHNRVQSLIRAGDLENASLAARQSVFSKIRATVFTCNALIAALYRNKRYDEAVAHFQFFFNQFEIIPNVVSYNYLINSHCDCGRVDEALDVYNQILADAPFSPSHVTYRHLTKGLIDAGRIEEAVDLLREMVGKGHGADSLVYNNLIKGFLDLENLEKANEIFDELKERCLVYDGIVNATFMDWFFGRGREKEALDSYRSLLDREFRMTPATCNVLLECLMKHNRKKEAWNLFESMLDNHTPPTFQGVNSDTFNIMVNDCFKLGKFDEAVDTFRKVGTKAKSKPFAMDVAGYTNMIVRFSEHGMISEAEKFFEELTSKSLSPDVTGYRTLIDAYFKEQRIDDAVNMFNRMVDANLRVIPEYANRWFSALIENDKAVEASQILTKLGERDPKPDATSYEIVIKGLCAVNKWNETRGMINQLMRYAVGVTSSLREFLYEAFGDQGWRDEIERLLDDRRLGFGWQPSHPPRPLGPFANASAAPAGSFTGFPRTPVATGYTGPKYSQSTHVHGQQNFQQLQYQHSSQNFQGQWQQNPQNNHWHSQNLRGTQDQHHAQPVQDQWHQYPQNSQPIGETHLQDVHHHPKAFQGQWNQYTQNSQPQGQQHVLHVQDQYQPKAFQGQDQGYQQMQDSQPQGQQRQQEVPGSTDSQAFPDQWQRRAFQG